MAAPCASPPAEWIDNYLGDGPRERRHLLDLNDFDETVASLAGLGRIALGRQWTLAVASDTASTTFSGIASGTGGLTKRGMGTLVLTGANSYTGATSHCRRRPGNAKRYVAG